MSAEGEFKPGVPGAAAEQADGGGEVRELSRLEGRVAEIKQEIIALREAHKEAQKKCAAEMMDLRQHWQDGLISSRAEFIRLSTEISKSAEFIHERLLSKYTEYRLARIEFLSRAVPPDERRKRVLSLGLRERIHLLQETNIQAGGANARGAFEIAGENLVIIKRSSVAYQYEGALPYIMQGIDSERVPRVFDVFQDGDATYSVMEKATGTQLDRLMPERLAEVPQEHYDQLADDVRSANSHGLSIDPSSTDNFFHDSERGFILIDLSDQKAHDPFAERQDQLEENMLRPALIGGERNQQVEEKIRRALARRQVDGAP